MKNEIAKGNSVVANMSASWTEYPVVKGESYKVMTKERFRNGEPEVKVKNSDGKSFWTPSVYFYNIKDE